MAVIGFDEEQGLRVLSTGFIVFGFITFVLMFIVGINAPYGRYTDGSWGPPIPARWAWVLQEAPSFLVPLICCRYAHNSFWESPRSVFLMIMFCGHYLNRTVIFPFRLTGGKQTPFAVFLMAFSFCLVNGYMQFHPKSLEDEGSFGALKFSFGVLLFYGGMAINIHSDGVLTTLRKPGETGYKIPHGGMFEYVSGANFLGEIIEWVGFAIASGSLPAAAFAFSTFCNIGPRAVHHHRWYMNKFKGEYPQDRKALIPFVW